ncbi:tetratricopeptide repeat protein [Alkalibacter mobilis]|uniref:tetratricopeptide repeat protein n=1 Tax=Alkalibacter mobilis TaxID=2787712 RepID=UPI00189FB4F3|nr:hypothetical protein [Alkalibacter mobilis]MBF7097736.1 hypothetical protein [Alkalibacter mobilis]
MKRSIILFCFGFLILIGGLLFFPVHTKANQNQSVFSGLYLIKGENVELSQVDISISVKNEETSTVTATYEATNTGSDTTSILMGVPLTELSMTDVKFRFSPYLYNSTIVSGDKINSLINNMSVNYASWRTFSFEIALKSGETKTASVTYTTENYSSEDGRLGFNIDLDHLASWSDKPKKVRINASFDPRTVQIYNFDNEFSIEPTEMSPQYNLTWEFDDVTELKEITFNYFPVDEKIKDEIIKGGDGELQEFVTAYETRNYPEVIKIGKEYVKRSQDDKVQNLVYLLMADAYTAQKDYTQTLAIYELITTSDIDYGDLKDRIENKIFINKIISMENLKNYEEMYDLIIYEQSKTNLGAYFEDWLDNAYNRIPEEDLEALIEERKPPTKFEMFLDDFLSGNFTVILIAASIGIVILLIIIYFIRRKRKNKFFY